MAGAGGPATLEVLETKAHEVRYHGMRSGKRQLPGGRPDVNAGAIGPTNSDPDGGMIMTDQPTCGTGLAENATLPAALGELLGDMARVLDVHRQALDKTDPNTAPEFEAYRRWSLSSARCPSDCQQSLEG